MERVQSGRRTPGSGADSTVSGFRQGAAGIVAAESGHSRPAAAERLRFCLGPARARAGLLPTGAATNPLAIYPQGIRQDSNLR